MYNPEQGLTYALDEKEEAPLTYNIDDTAAEAPAQAPVQQPSLRHPVMSLLKLMATPVQGWKDLKNQKFSSLEAATRCFWPLLILSSITSYIGPFLDVTMTWTDTILKSLGIFMTFLLSNYAILVGAKILLPKSEKKRLDTAFGHVFVMTCLSSLMLAVILWNLLPMLTPLLVFMPIYTIYLVVRGAKYLRISPEALQTSTIRLCVLILGMPMLFYWLFTEMI